MAVAMVGWDAAACGKKRHTGLGERGTKGHEHGDRRRDTAADLQGLAGLDLSPAWSPITPSTTPGCQAPRVARTMTSPSHIFAFALPPTLFLS